MIYGVGGIGKIKKGQSQKINMRWLGKWEIFSGLSPIGKGLLNEGKGAPSLKHFRWGVHLAGAKCPPSRSRMSTYPMGCPYLHSHLLLMICQYFQIYTKHLQSPCLQAKFLIDSSSPSSSIYERKSCFFFSFMNILFINLQHFPSHNIACSSLYSSKLSCNSHW